MDDIYKNEKWHRITFDDMDPDERVEISNFGRIKSYKTRPNTGKVLGGSWLSGYNILVMMRTGNRRKTLFVHKLVAEYFVSQPSSEHDQIIHVDYNKKNNHFSNLKWVTREGLAEHRRGDENYNTKKIRNSKLTESDVIRLKKMLKRGTMKPYHLAKEFGITHTQLNRIKNGENWQHITVD